MKRVFQAYLFLIFSCISSAEVPLIDAAKKAEALLSAETLKGEKLSALCKIWRLELVPTGEEPGAELIWKARLQPLDMSNRRSLVVDVDGEPQILYIAIDSNGVATLKSEEGGNPRVRRVPNPPLK